MLIAHNATRGASLMDRGRTANRPWARIRGLIGTAPLQPGEGLWITPTNGIHMWFMSYAIDVVYLDRGLRILALTENMVPWRTGRLVKGGHSVLELPVGTIAATSTHMGDVVQLQNV